MKKIDGRGLFEQLWADKKALPRRYLAAEKVTASQG
jgi:hypothetical protein